MFTSWSEVSTPAELSMKSVLIRPPPRAYSIRPSWVKPRLPPSATQRARSCEPSTRTGSLALSPAAEWGSAEALTKVPTPPLNSRSTGARRTALTSSFGVSRATCSGRPSAARTWGLTGTDFASRRYTPPPVEISAWS